LETGDESIAIRRLAAVDVEKPPGERSAERLLKV
jgi:hypothetical protein